MVVSMINPQEPQEKPIEILPNQISVSALESIIESFILREGTDYGREEASYDKKAEQIRRQLERGEIKMVFDQNSESVNFLTKREFQKLFKST